MVGHAASDRDIANQVRHVIRALFAAGGRSPEIHVVADSVGTSVRTLQRKLRATGLKYADVVQQARLVAARQMLKDRRRRIGEIARTLGYSDNAHFTRAFQRWTGLTPRDFRRGGVAPPRRDSRPDAE